MTRRLIMAALLSALTPGTAAAQGLPETAVWLLEFRDQVPEAPVRISKAGGYNNQPWFSADGTALYFTSEQEGGQTDVIRHELSTGAQTLVHPSPESEYSPLPVPGQNTLSVVRVELPDGRQRLWKLPLDGAGSEVLLPDIEPVGYHAWLDEDTIALFILGETFDLHIAEISTGRSQRVAVNIGRTLRKHPQTGHLLFVDKNTSPWRVADYDPESGELSTVMALFPDVEDFDIDSEGRYWMGVGGKLYVAATPASGWRLFADLSGQGITAITRIATGIRDGLQTIALASAYIECAYITAEGKSPKESCLIIN